MKLSHVAADASVEMIDISAKGVTSRFARAEAVIRMNAAARTALREATLRKGDALVAAQVAGIMAAKRTASLIPLAHPLPLDKIDVRFEWRDDGALRVETEARTSARTGVELEALVAASVAALTIYDMTKALDKGITIGSLRLLRKTGGKSGCFERVPSASTPLSAGSVEEDRGNDV